MKVICSGTPPKRVSKSLDEPKPEAELESPLLGGSLGFFAITFDSIPSCSLETTRHVSVITITLSKKELDTSSAGYQTPIPVDQVKPWNGYDYEGEGSPNMRGRGRGGRGRGRGRGSSNNGVVEYNRDGGWDGGRGYSGRGRVRGRGHGFRGCGRGYGGGDMQQDLGGYNDYGGSGAPFAQGRDGDYESVIACLVEKLGK
ncbi:hypothetical protein LOK49_LG08G01316 [Camellia lanceoleosa]|uniref:Uncharacterized protein n=1 Tax=Camellia lanceoleosa TaxID=1840588 RepID=A0ACC0GWK3_9ERIC|nr:hypothetical protein LOK49_LG08G01316 [Camellia lanceoleosa]